MRRGARTLAIAAIAVLGIASVALATTYRGAGVEDDQMPVRLKVSNDGIVSFNYSDVLVTCTNGDRVREPGADHSTTLDENAKFKDTIEAEVGGGTATSLIKGRLKGDRAKGIVFYDLVYEGGECHSDRVEWKAKRK